MWIVFAFVLAFLIVGILTINQIRSDAQAQENAGVLANTRVDPQKYMGLWYEIESMPAPFQKDCICTTAFYELLPNNTILVTNQCTLLSKEIKKANAIAWPVNDNNTWLKVNFVSPFLFKKDIFGWPLTLFNGDYWILHVDPDYRWAVVGSPDKKYAWILSRTQKMDPVTVKEAREILAQKGYNVSLLRNTCQIY